MIIVLAGRPTLRTIDYRANPCGRSVVYPDVAEMPDSDKTLVISHPPGVADRRTVARKAAVRGDR